LPFIITLNKCKSYQLGLLFSFLQMSALCEVSGPRSHKPLQNIIASPLCGVHNRLSEINKEGHNISGHEKDPSDLHAWGGEPFYIQIHCQVECDPRKIRSVIEFAQEFKQESILLWTLISMSPNAPWSLGPISIRPS
jgi:hypothetical protein